MKIICRLITISAGGSRQCLRWYRLQVYPASSYYPHATRKQGRAFVIDGFPPFTVKCLSAVPFCPKDVFNDPSDLGDSLPNHQIDAPVNDVVSLTSDVTADRQVYFSLNAFVNLSAHRNKKGGQQWWKNSWLLRLITTRNSKCGKVMLSLLCLSVHRGLGGYAWSHVWSHWTVFDITPEISPLKARCIWLDDCKLYLQAVLNAIK